ncbi:hypothetical protein LXA43DRAFT_124293 [Ganoderma leucocontextum]|nr:hypothetical protein LXA43DRAFT_124293 [Ganoderma leucocontextum]
MALESGMYHIFSKLGDGPVGRRNVEDLSLNPKGVYKLPQGAEDAVWVVEKLSTGNYTLKIWGAIVGALDTRVLAFLNEDQALLARTEWTLQCDESDAEGNAYVVTKAGGHQDGWVVDNTNVLEPIMVRPIITGRSLPPYYPPSEVFVFKKVN